MINSILRNHPSLSGSRWNNRETNKSVITHGNTDSSLYCKHRQLKFPLIRDSIWNIIEFPHNSYYFTMIYWSIYQGRHFCYHLWLQREFAFLLWNISHREPKIDLNYSYGTRPNVITLNYTQYFWFPKLNTLFSMPKMTSIHMI